MGCGTSSVIDIASGGDSFKGKKWKQKLSKHEAREKYTSEGSLSSDASDGLLELRVCLDEPVLLGKFGAYVKDRACLQVLMCWSDILEYKSINDKAIDYKMSKLNNIYVKYIKQPAVVALPAGLIGEDIEAEFNRIFNDNKSFEKIPTTITTSFSSASGTDNKLHSVDSSKVRKGFLDNLMKNCLKVLYDEAFKDYKSTTGYKYQIRYLSQQYNQVSVDDFDYMESLGSGGYGFVVHCRKKSTGKHYAMSKYMIQIHL